VVSSRRIARELALKVLFQIDVGKQPRAEVLEGALDQIRATVGSPIEQIARHIDAGLHRLTAQYGEGLSVQGKRHLKLAVEAAVSEMRSLVEKAVEKTRAVVAENPQTNPEAAETDLRAALEEARAGLLRLAGRETLPLEVSRALREVADKKAPQIVETLRKHLSTAAQMAAFVVSLVHGVTAYWREIDARLAALSSGWSLERQAAVDRNIMRLAAYEILYLPDIPIGASINEAVELAKKYSTAESGRFVNGVLGALAGQKVNE